MKRQICYLLYSKRTNKTYIGYTCDIKRRIRQHNGEIKGGAKHTRMGRPWKIVAYISGFENNTTALQFEWAWKHLKKIGKRKTVKNNKENIKNFENISKLENNKENLKNRTNLKNVNN